MLDFILNEWLVGFGVPILISVGFALVGDEFKEYKAARWCFCISAAWIYGKVLMWSMTESEFRIRAIVVFLVFGIVGVGLMEVIRLSSRREKSQAKQETSGTTESAAPLASAPPNSSQPSVESAKEELSKPSQSATTVPTKVHEPPIERTAKFTVMIPYDTTPGAFPVPTNENSSDPLSKRYSEFYWMGVNGTIPQALRETASVRGTINIDKPTPVSFADSSDFLARLLQYDIFHNIDSLQHDSMTLTIGAPTEANAGVDPPDAERYSYEKLFKELENNPFYRPFLHRPSGDDMSWKVKPSKFPKGIQITFPTDSTDKPDKYLVRFYRPQYYKADFIVEAFMGTKFGELPKNFESKNASMVMQWSFIVKMHYRIEHPDDEEFNPSVYAQWLDALYDGLKKRLASD
jgi:hypothetical protein